MADSSRTERSENDSSGLASEEHRVGVHGRAPLAVCIAPPPTGSDSDAESVGRVLEVPDDPFALFRDAPKDEVDAGPKTPQPATPVAQAILPQTSPTGGAEAVFGAVEPVQEVVGRGPETNEFSEQAGSANADGGYSAGTQASPAATPVTQAILSQTSQTGGADADFVAVETASQEEEADPAEENEPHEQAGPVAVPRSSGGTRHTIILRFGSLGTGPSRSLYPRP